MGKVLFVMLLAYLLGTLNPAALIAVMKKTNLRNTGTGNLGATNTMLTFGLKHGIIVMICDIFKAYIAVKIAKLLAPRVIIAWFLAGCCAVIGHIFPFYMNFRGGKGVATFAGMVLAMEPVHFVILLGIGVALAFLTNYAFAVPVSAAALYPFLMYQHTSDFLVFLLLLGIGALIIFKHSNNFVRVRKGTEITVQQFLCDHRG